MAIKVALHSHIVAPENSKLFEEKVKRWHDKRIQKREFKVGEYFLLYNSRFRFFVGTFLSKWKGPYDIEGVYRYGTIKINNAEGTNPESCQWAKNKTLFLRYSH